jgi:hypothetical protein
MVIIRQADRVLELTLYVLKALRFMTSFPEGKYRVFSMSVENVGKITSGTIIGIHGTWLIYIHHVREWGHERPKTK